MNSYETYRVCRDCFISTKFSNPPTLEKYYRDGNCQTCGNKWIGINVGYHNQERKWYEVRPRSFDSTHSLCRNHQFGKCYRPHCRNAHNKLELQFWIEEEDLIMKRKRPGAHKIRCVICRIDFREIPNLRTHMKSNEHWIMTDGMRILRDVGSSLEYTGPIRTRPKPSLHTNTYEMCKNFTKNGRCGYGTGCKHAHSEEELKVWKQAHMGEEEIRLRNRETNSQRPHDPNPQSSSNYASNDANSSRTESVLSQNKSGTCKYLSSPSFEKNPVFKRRAEEYSRVTEKIEGESEYGKRMYEEIDMIGIEDVINNRPDHIEILCDKYLTQTLEDSNEFKWLLRMKSSKPDQIQGILLYDHRNVFKLGEVHTGFEGGRRSEVKFSYLPNRTCYQLHQEVTKDTYIDIVVIFKPRIGQHQVNFVVEWKDGVLVARKIRARMRGAEFREVTETFKAETQPTPKKKVPPVQGNLPVNWEQGYQLINADFLNKHKIPDDIDFLNKHQIPDNMEERVNTGFFDKINDMIVKEQYFIRFDTLLYLEEFEHKKALSKYDLIDYKITFDTFYKKITLENGFGQERVETAQVNCGFIKFQLRHQLFEGYRGFRPPKIAYIIPKNTKTAYECSCIHIGSDYLVFSITMDAVRACVWSEGLAMVRFAPERDEYEKMHQALEDMEPLSEAILFPTLRKVKVFDQWDEDHLLSLLRFWKISDTQKEAVYSIINSKYISFPTIICGPFGCGKTKTLSAAAILIAWHFHGSRILIVTKTNSCANLHVQLLYRDFDTIQMLRDGQKERPILFRHFARKRKLLHYDRSVKDYTNIQDGFYERLPLSELEKCSIIIATTVGCSNLIDRKDRENAKNLFTHIFIDEAAQLIEPEACIPLSLAGLDTKIALAGDVRQSRPLILSKHGRQFHLDQSLLERLDTLPEYQSESPYKCKISLTENYRSSKEIVNFLSELFYEGSLRANPPRLQGPENFPSLSFLHVKGEEERLHGFPSFYNEEEAEATIRVLKKFTSLGMRVSRMIVLTTYRAQIRLINDALRKETTKCRDLGHFEYVTQYCKKNNCVNHFTIEVTNLDTIQGRENDLIIVNTVRTTTNLPKDISLEEKVDLGLLDDVTQFNTILTRARGWVVVIGDSDCVTNIGDCSNVWSKYLDACESNQGFFKSLEDFEDFGNMKYEQAGKREDNKNEKPPETSEIGSSVGSIEDVVPLEDQPSETYQTKYNLLHAFITVCQHEIAQVHASTEITAVINDQLTYAKLALENLGKQRFLEQQATLTQIQPSVSVQNPHLMNVTLVPDCTRVAAPQLVAPSSDIIQPPMEHMQPQPMTHQQPSQHSYYKYNPILPK